MNSNTFMHIVRLMPILLISLLVGLSGCGGSSSVNTRMDVAEELMEIRPDSALAILDSVDVSDIGGKREKARYALLKSMALDKNVMDTTTFDILQPAIDYYLKDGTPDEKLRTYYYQGRIYQNRNDRDSAMRSFMRGLDLAPVCKDSLLIAKTLVAQGILCHDLYDINGFVENYLRAGRLYHSQNKNDIEFDCMLYALSGSVILGNKLQADSIINILDKYDFIDDEQKRVLEACRLSYLIQFGTKQDLMFIDREGKENIVFDANGIMNLGLAYNKVGDNERALQYIEYLDNAGLEYDTLKFLSIKFRILEDMGKHESALAVYKDCINRLEAANSRKFMHMNRTMENKHQLELQAERDARQHARILWLCIGSIIFLGMGILILSLIIRRNKAMKDLALQTAHAAELENRNLKSENELTRQKARTAELENENLVQRVATLESESEELKELLESQKEMPEEVRKAIRTRVEMLNSYLASRISDHKEFEKAYDEWVDGLTADTQAFMDSNRLAFQASHPQFINYFEDHGLTESEINYVCLYAIGLRGKDVGNYMRMRSHVNISSAIRRKLGIDRHETNIGIYVRKLLKNM